MDTWRLIISLPACGAWNMAVDEAILEAAGRGDVPPTLRLYAWQPPCLSLGHSQPFTDVDVPRLRQRGWELVRRPTGGRAILHTDELTYSVIAPAGEPRTSGGVLESYHRLAQGLLAALRSLGLPVGMQAQAGAAENGGANPVCFEVPSIYEITVQGKKLVGSAQARRKQGVLQHGSLPLGGDLTRITQILVFPDEAARAEAVRRLLARATTVESVLGRVVDWETAAQAFIQGFASALDLTLKREELSPLETARAGELVSRKYAHPLWTK